VVASKVRKQRAAAATALTNKEEKDTEDEEIRRQKQTSEEGTRRTPKSGHLTVKTSKVYPINPRKYGDLDNNGSSNIVLYIGLGMVAIGLVITFVGLGDKGFQTLELQLVGPSLVGCGFIFAILQILYCTFPSLGRSCCDQNEESDKLLREEEILEFKQIRENCHGNGQADRNYVQHNSSSMLAIKQSKTNPENLRPILKNSRQIIMNGGHDPSIKHQMNGILSHVDNGVKSVSNVPHKSDLILNSKRLLVNKELINDTKTTIY